MGKQTAIVAALENNGNVSDQMFLNALEKSQKMWVFSIFFKKYKEISVLFKVGKHIAISIVDQNVKVMSKYFLLVEPFNSTKVSSLFIRRLLCHKL